MGYSKYLCDREGTGVREGGGGLLGILGRGVPPEFPNADPI